jgi:hypothetical protein
MSDALELSRMFFSKDDPELRRRIRIVRTMEERGIYGPAEPRL